VTLTVTLACAAALLALSVVAVVIGRSRAATRIVYGASLIIATISLAAALTHLLLVSEPFRLTLPLGVPWIGAHFRLDALSAFFLAVVDLGAASASLFALGYGQHEQTPQRVLPFYPAFLAGMTLVVIADDAFTFLVSWEFMSLTSWALVMAHHPQTSLPRHCTDTLSCVPAFKRQNSLHFP
jgi:hydrogenase-4 component B